MNKNNKKLKAVIDLGTNTCRLFIAEVHKEKIVKRYRKEMEIVTLGEDVNQTNTLKENAIERTLKCLKNYKKICDQMDISEIKAVATSATRDALNRDIFLERVKNEIGIVIECISGKEEGTFTFNGATLDFFDDIVLLDIGGGSTEIIYGNSKKIKFIKSFDIGAVRIKEKFFRNDNFIDNYDEGKKWVLNTISEIEFLKDKKFILVAVAGTATTQVSVKEKMSNYNSEKVHKFVLSRKDIENNIVLYNSLNLEDRKKIIGLHPKRADVIIGGTYILDWIMEFL
ncbi:MAG: Ppx/GppA family phosphatase, partial [Fusobacteriaceae bacterium]|nr:Ppx/GppA family phosphatase [Fusobacteriaceae bacterium]